jgi:type III secretory pathway component EscS
VLGVGEVHVKLIVGFILGLVQVVTAVQGHDSLD